MTNPVPFEVRLPVPEMAPEIEFEVPLKVTAVAPVRFTPEETFTVAGEIMFPFNFRLAGNEEEKPPENVVVLLVELLMATYPVFRNEVFEPI